MKLKPLVCVSRCFSVSGFSVRLGITRLPVYWLTSLSSDNLPWSRNCIIAVAVNVLEMEATRNWVVLASTGVRFARLL
ncbi:hypothetical protein D3C77_406730 [compost metagenome]